MTDYIIRDDQIENLREVQKKIETMHEGAALILKHTLDSVEWHPLEGEYK